MVLLSWAAGSGMVSFMHTGMNSVYQNVVFHGIHVWCLLSTYVLPCMTKKPR